MSASILSAPSRDELIVTLSDFYGVHQRIWRDMETATLARAWRTVQLHHLWPEP